MFYILGCDLACDFAEGDDPFLVALSEYADVSDL